MYYNEGLVLPMLAAGHAIKSVGKGISNVVSNANGNDIKMAQAKAQAAVDMQYAKNQQKLDKLNNNLQRQQLKHEERMAKIQQQAAANTAAVAEDYWFLGQAIGSGLINGGKAVSDVVNSVKGTDIKKIQSKGRTAVDREYAKNERRRDRQNYNLQRQKMKHEERMAKIQQQAANKNANTAVEEEYFLNGYYDALYEIREGNQMDPNLVKALNATNELNRRNQNNFSRTTNKYVMDASRHIKKMQNQNHPQPQPQPVSEEYMDIISEIAKENAYNAYYEAINPGMAGMVINGVSKLSGDVHATVQHNNILKNTENGVKRAEVVENNKTGRNEATQNAKTARYLAKQKAKADIANAKYSRNTSANIGKISYQKTVNEEFFYQGYYDALNDIDWR